MFKIAVEIDIDSLVNKALEIEDKRAKNIILNRFGLKSPKRRTLASLGEEYSLTRERVRQIEAATLKTVKERIKDEKHSLAFLELVESYLETVAKLRRSDMLAKDIALMAGRVDADSPIFENKLNFLARVFDRPYVVDANQDMHTFWHTDDSVRKTALKLIDKLLKTKEHDFEKYLESAIAEHKLPESTILNYLSISKRFGVGPYGHMGADHWLHVNPKTVRDRAYLVLKQADAPMHFREIADSVNAMSDRKRAHATVHNELIRDPRFSLVGRGTYFLNE